MPSVDVNEKEQWTQADLDRWLENNRVAEWVGPWFRQLEARLGESLPELIRRGLGDHTVVPRWMAPLSKNPVWLRRFLSINDLTNTWFNQAFLEEDPEWLNQLTHLEEAGIARSFLLTGNINDYAYDPVHGFRPASRLLIDTLRNVKDCVLYFSLSRGLRFYAENPHIRDRLPNSLKNRLDTGGWNNRAPLLSTVCSLFDDIDRWLTGNQACGEEQPDSSQLSKGVAIILENVHLIFPTDAQDLERSFLIDNLLRWSNSPELFRSSHCLVLTAESLTDVNNDLRSRGGKIEQIDIPRPGEMKQRLKFLIPLLDPQSEMKETRVARLSGGIARLEGYSGNYEQRLSLLAHDCAGLTFLGIEDLLQQASASPNASLSRSRVMTLKRRRLSQESEGLLEVIDPKRTLDDIGGYDELKTRIREIIQALKVSHDPLVQRSIPMGVLFLGPPGTGKSVMATAMAGESEVSMARLGNFRGMYVGQSERNLSRIFSLIESLHPVIVFIDEFDQALGQRSTSSSDSGVDNRIFGQFLEFMSRSEHRGRILWVGASNFPQKIDPAIKRPGRFDLIIPFMMPDLKSRKAIFKVLLENALAEVEGVDHTLTDPGFTELAQRTEGMTGAELESIVNEVLRRTAGLRAQGAESPGISLDSFHEVLQAYSPPANQHASYKKMEDLAIAEVCFLDLLPESYRKRRMTAVERRTS